MSEHHVIKSESVYGWLESRRQELTQRQLRVADELAHQEPMLSPDSTPQALQMQSDATLHAISTAADAELAEVDEALQRMAQGEYGVCRDCGQPIAPLRLAELPQAVTCAACAR